MTSIRPIGWFMRHVPKGTTATHFWMDQLGFPLLRKVGAAMDILWAGEAIVVELAYSLADGVPADLPWGYMPVFRVHDLDKLLAHLKTKDLAPTEISKTSDQRQAVFLDPHGHPVALRERAKFAELPQDREAQRRAKRGEAFDPGCKAMPDGIQELGWVVRRVADVGRMAAFYENVIGLKLLEKTTERVSFDLGDNVILEVVPGGKAIAPPTDRKEAPSFMIMRVDHIADFRKRLVGHGVTIINERIEVYWGEVSYFLDPEGYVIGMEAAVHPGNYAPEKLPLSEGLEAERRWREYKSQQNAR